MDPFSWAWRRWKRFMDPSPCRSTGLPCDYEQDPDEVEGLVRCRDCGWLHNKNV